MSALRAACALAVAASGCASLVEIEDVQQHLPRLDGKYVVTISRVRTDSNPPDVVRLRGNATLDPETRTFNFSAVFLEPLPENDQLGEASISNVVFPDDSDEVEFTLVLNLPTGAVVPPPLEGDGIINTPVRFIAEAEYSFCAKDLPGDREVTLGSRLIPDDATIPTTNNATCDDPLRD